MGPPLRPLLYRLLDVLGCHFVPRDFLFLACESFSSTLMLLSFQKLSNFIHKTHLKHIEEKAGEKCLQMIDEKYFV